MRVFQENYRDESIPKRSVKVFSSKGFCAPKKTFIILGKMATLRLYPTPISPGEVRLSAGLIE